MKRKSISIQFEEKKIFTFGAFDSEIGPFETENKGKTFEGHTVEDKWPDDRDEFE